MDNKRWCELERDGNARLTQEELAQGWHFCPDWDFMVVGPGMDAIESCTCQLPVSQDLFDPL